MKLVKDVMNKKVIYFKPEDSIFKAAKIFSEKEISGAPVIKKEKVIGIISESDIVKFMSSELGKKVDTTSASITSLLFTFVKHYSKLKDEMKRISKTIVKDVMSKRVVAICSSANLFDAASLMQKKDVNRLPVIDDGKLVGIIARADLIKALVE